MIYELWFHSIVLPLMQYHTKGFVRQRGGGSGVIVRRSATCGYESYCLSGKGGAVNWRPRLRWFFVFEDVFWLEKPYFHNSRIHSVARINIRNLPGRQNFRYSYVTLTNNPRKYHNPCTAVGQCLSPYLRGTMSISLLLRSIPVVENNLRNHFIKPWWGDHSLIIKLLSHGHPYRILCLGSVSFSTKKLSLRDKINFICLIYELWFHSIVLPLMQYHTKGFVRQRVSLLCDNISAGRTLPDYIVSRR